MRNTLFTIAVLFVVLRIGLGLAVAPERASLFGSFEALSHVVVGGVGLVAFVVWRCKRMSPTAFKSQMVDLGGVCFWLFCWLCVVEVFVAAATRILPLLP
jgi:hypothetical protein